jgi:hypothetical protein
MNIAIWVNTDQLSTYYKKKIATENGANLPRHSQRLYRFSRNISYRMRQYSTRLTISCRFSYYLSEENIIFIMKRRRGRNLNILWINLPFKVWKALYAFGAKRSKGNLSNKRTDSICTYCTIFFGFSRFGSKVIQSTKTASLLRIEDISVGL